MQTTLHALAGLAFLSALGVVLADDSPFRGDPEDLVGGYTIVSGESNGQKEPSDRIEGTTVRFTKDDIVVTSKDKKEVYALTYKIEGDKAPFVIKMKTKLAPREGEVAMGLLKKDGDTITLIYALPGGDAPTGFKTKEKQNLFVLKNEHKGGEGKGDGGK